MEFEITLGCRAADRAVIVCPITALRTKDLRRLDIRQKPSARERARCSAWAMCLGSAGRLQCGPTRCYMVKAPWKVKAAVTRCLTLRCYPNHRPSRCLHCAHGFRAHGLWQYLRANGTHCGSSSPGRGFVPSTTTRHCSRSTMRRSAIPARSACGPKRICDPVRPSHLWDHAVVLRSDRLGSVRGRG